MKTKLLIIIGIIMMTTIPFVTYAMLDWYSDSVLPDSFDIDTSPKPGDKYYIEPERLTQLVAVGQDLRDKITQLHQKSPLTAYGVNLDYATKKIIVIVETEQFNSEIEQIISEYPNDIPIVFYNSKIELQDEFEPEEPNCGPNTFLNEIGVCQVMDGGCEPDIDGNTTWCGPQYDYLKIILSEPSAFLFVFGTPSLIAGIVIGVVIWRKRK